MLKAIYYNFLHEKSRTDVYMTAGFPLIQMPVYFHFSISISPTEMIPDLQWNEISEAIVKLYQGVKIFLH